MGALKIVGVDLFAKNIMIVTKIIVVVLLPILQLLQIFEWGTAYVPQIMDFIISLLTAKVFT